MVQGTTFKRKQTGKPNKATAAKAKKASAVKRGARVVPPKTADVIKKIQLTKKLTAAVNKKTEDSMAIKASSIGQRLKTLKAPQKELTKAEKKALKKK
ncbi:hypothetical protein DSO57_1020988 [Entomophthora muscae]|uniref:Uncharacterized protein n=1 Tax=Entomophthora muscae TaxID=34485 RepID=A0ACC2UNZ2_9FUNG|nr:hypothetical protein DSO57_1020988 [Entomophthora muscae]